MGTIYWSYKDGWWAVVDDEGRRWDVINMDGNHALIQRGSYGMWYGASWQAGAAGSSRGEITPAEEGLVDLGYRFTTQKGWVEV